MCCCCCCLFVIVVCCSLLLRDVLKRCGAKYTIWIDWQFARKNHNRIKIGKAGGGKLDILPLLGVNGVGVRRARALLTAGMHSVEQLANADATRVVTALANLLHGAPELRLRSAQKLINNGKYDAVRRCEVK